MKQANRRGKTTDATRTQQARAAAILRKIERQMKEVR